jgi:hypothetical protein
MSAPRCASPATLQKVAARIGDGGGGRLCVTRCAAPRCNATRKFNKYQSISYLDPEVGNARTLDLRRNAPLSWSSLRQRACAAVIRPCAGVRKNRLITVNDGNDPAR